MNEKESLFLQSRAKLFNTYEKEFRESLCFDVIPTIRLNKLISNPGKIKELLVSNGFELEYVEWIENVYMVHNKSKFELAQSSEYKKGLFYIQNLSSMIPAIELDPNDKEKVLDLTAAPGSKTIQIAELMDNKGEIIANDINKSRLKDMKWLLSQFNVKNVKITNMNGEKFGELYPGYFDKVLLDTPCSGEGLVNFCDDKPLKYWTEKRVKVYSEKQKGLITSAFKSLKPGGTLVYSTCTLNVDENEAIVDFLLRNSPSAEVQEIGLASDDAFNEYKKYTSPGIDRWDGTEFDRSVEKSMRVRPNERMIGFFVCVIRKG